MLTACELECSWVTRMTLRYCMHVYCRDAVPSPSGARRPGRGFLSQWREAAGTRFPLPVALGGRDAVSSLSGASVDNRLTLVGQRAGKKFWNFDTRRAMRCYE
jgi:hypothetical protein